MSDAVLQNTFFNLLQNEFKRKYDQAILKCWTICIPCIEALRGVDICEEFVDTHILHPVSPNILKSTNSKENLIFQLTNSSLRLLSQDGDDATADTITSNLNKQNLKPDTSSEKYTVNILSIERGLNVDYRPYQMFITDKPLSPKFKTQQYTDISNSASDNEHGSCQTQIHTIQDAINFLNKYSNHRKNLEELENDLHSFIENERTDFEEPWLRNRIHKIVTSHWVQIMTRQAREIQRESSFQHKLSAAIEHVVVSRLHYFVFSTLSRVFYYEDEVIYRKCLQFSEMKVSSDQLGAPEDFSIPLPAALVELAALDNFTSPMEKLSCLQTTIDLIMAELKGAIADVEAITLDSKYSRISEADLVPVVIGLIIQSKPLHMFANLHYMENYQWTLLPNDKLSFTLALFKNAVNQLTELRLSNLLPKSLKVKNEFGLADFLEVATNLDHARRKGKQDTESGDEEEISTLDRQLGRLTDMIEKSTLDGIKQNKSNKGNNILSKIHL